MFLDCKQRIYHQTITMKLINYTAVLVYIAALYIQIGYTEDDSESGEHQGRQFL